MTCLRKIDRWFIDSILPYRPGHLEYAERLAGNRAEADDIMQDAYTRLIALSDWQRLENPHALPGPDAGPRSEQTCDSQADGGAS